MRRSHFFFGGVPTGRVRGMLLVVYMAAGLGVLAGARASGVDVLHPRAQLRHVFLPLAKSMVGSQLGPFAVSFPTGGQTIDVRPRTDPPDGDYALWEEGAKSLCSHLGPIAPADPLRVRVLDHQGQVRCEVVYEPPRDMR